MDNEKTKLLEVLTSILNDSKEFVIDQSPLYAQEIVKWEISKAYIGITLFLLLAITLFALSRFIYKKFGRGGDDIFVLPLGVGTICLFLTLAPITHLIKAKVAPRVVIIDSICEKLNAKSNND
jgi:hypothetical protein